MVASHVPLRATVTLVAPWLDRVRVALCEPSAVGVYVTLRVPELLRLVFESLNILALAPLSVAVMLPLRLAPSILSSLSTATFFLEVKDRVVGFALIEGSGSPGPVMAEGFLAGGLP